MMGKMIFCIAVLVFVLTLGYVQAGLAASTLTVTPSGDGVFVVQGTAMDNIAAMDITIRYDTVSLANPRIRQGDLVSGALTAVNTNSEGTVRIGIIRTTPIKGSGVIATLDFNKTTGSAGKIKNLSARLSALDGRPLPVMVHVSNPPDSDTTTVDTPREEQRQDVPDQPVPAADSSPEAVNDVIFIPRAAIARSGNLPGITLPEGKNEQDANEMTAIPEPVADLPEKSMYTTEKNDYRDTGPKELDNGTFELTAVGPSGDTGDEQLEKSEGKIHIQMIQKSMLDRFQEYKGERSPQAYLSLFQQDSTDGFHQEPSVVLADGKASVKVVIKISGQGLKDVLKVGVTGGRLMSMKRDPTGADTWLVDLQPDKDTHMVSLTVPLEKFEIVFPLTVAPRQNIDLDKSGTVTEADFSLFLKEQIKQGSPVFDLNGDGRRDSLDDYIYTVNYLAAQRAEKGITLK